MPCFSNCFLAKAEISASSTGMTCGSNLDDGHVDAHRAVERGELDADRARTHDQQRLRHFRRHHRLEIGPDQLAVRLDAGQRARPGAGRDDDVLGGVGALALGVLGQRRLRLHRLLGRSSTTTISLALVSLASPQMTSTLFFFIRKPTPPFMRCAMPRERSTIALRSGADLALDLQAVVLGMLGIVEDLGRAQQRLGRDAAPVGADAGQMLALDDRRLEAELRGADRRDIAAGARADDDHVVGFGQQASSAVPFDLDVSSRVQRIHDDACLASGASAVPIARVFAASRWTPSSGVVWRPFRHRRSRSHQVGDFAIEAGKLSRFGIAAVEHRGEIGIGGLAERRRRHDQHFRRRAHRTRKRGGGRSRQALDALLAAVTRSPR